MLKRFDAKTVLPRNLDFINLNKRTWSPSYRKGLNRIQ